MPQLDVKVLGAELIKKNLEKVLRGTGRGIARGLDLVAADLLQRSADLAPILTGDLIRSGRVIRKGAISRGTISRTVSYGTGHAVFAHEEVTPAGSFGLGPISRIKDQSARPADGPIGGHFLLRPFLLHKNRYIKFLNKTAGGGAGFRISGGAAGKP